MVDYHTRREPINWKMFFIEIGFICITLEVFWDVISFFLWGL